MWLSSINADCFQWREQMKGVRVLVIDDETAISKMIARLLSIKGYQVDTADSGEQGIEKLLSDEYNLVITDMLMGKMSGDEVLENVRNLKGDIPVIAMSGTPWLMDGHQFDAVIPKPYSLKTLVAIVQNCLSPPYSC
jgi:DNA-binding response OmpR family regulator